MEKNEIALEILAYLADHPDAQDTLDGIAEWWLLERNIKRQRDVVKDALADLVKEELIVEARGQDSRVFYQANKKRLEDIREMIQRQT